MKLNKDGALSVMNGEVLTQKECPFVPAAPPADPGGWSIGYGRGCGTWCALFEGPIRESDSMVIVLCHDKAYSCLTRDFTDEREGT